MPAVAQQRRIAASARIHRGVDADRAGKAVDQRAGGEWRARRTGEQAGLVRQRWRCFGKGGDEAARGVSSSCSAWSRRRCRATDLPASYHRRWCCRQCPRRPARCRYRWCAGDAGNIARRWRKAYRARYRLEQRVPSPVVMTMSLSPRVKVETGHIPDLLQQPIALVKRVGHIAARARSRDDGLVRILELAEQ